MECVEVNIGPNIIQRITNKPPYYIPPEIHDALNEVGASWSAIYTELNCHYAIYNVGKPSEVVNAINRNDGFSAKRADLID
jgi:hypothetical protein